METPFRQEGEAGQSVQHSDFVQLQTKITHLLAAYHTDTQATEDPIPVELSYADKFRYLLIEVASVLAAYGSQ